MSGEGEYSGYKKIISRLLLLGCIYCVIGCSLFKPELTRRYKTAESKDARDIKIVTVSAFTIDQPAAKNDLADSRSISALITTAGAKAKNVEELRSNLEELGILEKKEVNIDKTAFKKRIVFCVDVNKDLVKKQALEEYGSNKNFGLADRINNFSVTLAMNCDQVRFASWDKFLTQEESVDLGTATLTRGGTAQLASTITTGSVAPYATITPTITATRSLEEEVTLKQRRIKLAGKFSQGGRKAEFRQEGAVGTDLTGTSAVDVDIKYKKPQPESETKEDGSLIKVRDKQIKIFSLRKKESKASDNSKTSQPAKQPPHPFEVTTLNLKYLVFLNNSIQPITCKLSYHFMLRHAKSDQIISEGEQNVVFYEGTVQLKLDLVLVNEEELKATVYRIGYREWRLGIKQIAKDVEASEGPGSIELGFPSFAQAIDFLNSLKVKENRTSFLKDYKPVLHAHLSPEPKRPKIHLKDVDLQEKDIANLRVQIDRLNY